MSQPDKLGLLATRLISNAKCQWSDLVHIAFAIEPQRIAKAAEFLAKETGNGAATIKRKLEAIQAGKARGEESKTVIGMGQSKCLAAYVKAKKAQRTDRLVAFPHRLTQPVRDDLQELCYRLARILKVKTYDEVFELVMSLFADLTDDEVRHLAGECIAKTNGQARG